jgi:hypothetical protein
MCVDIKWMSVIYKDLHSLLFSCYAASICRDHASHLGSLSMPRPTADRGPKKLFDQRIDSTARDVAQTWITKKARSKPSCSSLRLLDQTVEDRADRDNVTLRMQGSLTSKDVADASTHIGKMFDAVCKAVSRDGTHTVHVPRQAILSTLEPDVRRSPTPVRDDAIRTEAAFAGNGMQLGKRTTRATTWDIVNLVAIGTLLTVLFVLIVCISLRIGPKGDAS